MTKFKVGDKVRKVSGAGSPYEGTVERVYSDGHPVVRITKEGEGRYFGVGSIGNDDLKYYELISAAPEAPRSVEELIEISNAGARARAELYSKHMSEIEHDEDVYDGPGLFRGSPARVLTVKLKPKPVFEPFTVGSWAVSLAGQTLHIGCKSFDARDFASMLRYYRSGSLACDSYTMSARAIVIAPSRAGLRFNFNSRETHSLKWEDADRILAALEKAKV